MEYTATETDKWVRNVKADVFVRGKPVSGELVVCFRTHALDRCSAMRTHSEDKEKENLSNTGFVTSSCQSAVSSAVMKQARTSVSFHDFPTRDDIGRGSIIDTSSATRRMNSAASSKTHYPNLPAITITRSASTDGPLVAQLAACR